MRSLKTLIVIALFSACLTGSAFAQTTQQVTYEVQAINKVSITGSPSLVVNSATAGSAPDAATDASSTYSITTNESSKKITAAIGSALPTGVTLSLNMAAPTSSGTSAGSVSLSSTAMDMVTGISSVEESGLSMTYELQATTAAGPVASTSETVTFTITDGV